MALRVSAAVAGFVERGRNPRFLSIYPHINPRFGSSIPPSHHLHTKISFLQPKQDGRWDKLIETSFDHQIRAINTKSEIEPKGSSITEEEKISENWKIKMLYDGDCPLCMKEVNMLRERNKLYGAIKFVDISSDDYSPNENLNIDYKTAMGRIHAIQSDGTIVTDVEAFRRLYEEVGLGWVYAVTKYKPVDRLWKMFWRQEVEIRAKFAMTTKLVKCESLLCTAKTAQYEDWWR